MIHFNLSIKKPKGKLTVPGRLNIDEFGFAQFYSKDGNKIIASMCRVRIESASADGILLSGLQKVEDNKYIFQEWWLTYPLNN